MMSTRSTTRRHLVKVSGVAQYVATRTLGRLGDLMFNVGAPTGN